MSSTNLQIAKDKAKVVRRILIKRRDKYTGLFESAWVDISSDVKNFGNISKSIDAIRPFKFKFNNFTFEVSNEGGRYNPHDNESSLWYGYLNQQRTLVRVEVAFLDIDDTSREFKILQEYPQGNLWDASYFDIEGHVFDAPGSAIFTGILSGDIGVSDKNSVTFQVKPLSSVFEDFPASRLSGYTSGGISASDFVASIRDAVDSGGNYIFRPFFGDTTTYWDISTTSQIYPTLDSVSSVDIIDKNCWEVVEKLSEAENFTPFITGDGTFKFVSRSSVATAASYEFHGAGSFNPNYGNTIKSIDSYGFKPTKYYSRVQIKYKSEDTSTSYATEQADFVVGPANNPWILGDRTLNITNTFIGTATVAEPLALALFNDLSALKKELSFKTSLILGLDIFDRFAVYYDPSETNPNSLWDLKNWADTTAGDDSHLTWDQSDGEQVILSGAEFKFINFSINLDSLECDFLAREL